MISADTEQKNNDEPRQVDSESPSTTLYMLIPPSPLFAAHWSLFLPDILPYDPRTRRHEESNLGTRIHVTGDRLKGFQLEIVRQYNFRKDRGVAFNRRFSVGIVPREYLHRVDSLEEDDAAKQQTCKKKDEDEGGGFVDNTPMNAFEQVCVDIEAPGPSLKSVSASGGTLSVGTGKRVKSEIRDCQWWARQVVQELCWKDLIKPLPPSKDSHEAKSPIEVVNHLPKN